MILDEKEYRKYKFSISQEDLDSIYEMNKKLEKNKRYMRKLKKFIKKEKKGNS